MAPPTKRSKHDRRAMPNQAKKVLDHMEQLSDIPGMATTAHVRDELRDAFKGHLALRGLNLTQGIEGLMQWTVLNPDEAAALIRAHLDGRDAGTRSASPTKHPGGPRSGRRPRGNGGKR